MLRLSHLTGTIALALAATTLPTAPAQAAPDTSDNEIKIIQHNTDKHGPAPAIRAASDWGGVDAITFQELCKSEQQALSEAGYRVVWREQRAAGDGRCASGIAIATVHEFADTTTDTLIVRGEGDERREFKLLCADLKGTGVAKTTVCTSHFPLDYNGDAAPTGEQNRIAVANGISKVLNPRIAAGRRVVLAGDFNDDPKSPPLDRLYKVNGNGEFWEGDQRCGDTVCRAMEPTTDNGRRLDYFFASAPGVNKLSGVSKLAAKEYDPEGHFVIRGSVRFGAL